MTLTYEDNPFRPDFGGMPPLLAGRTEELITLNAGLKQLQKGITPTTVIISAPRGMGKSVLCARPLLGDEPFAVILPDDLIYHATSTCLQQMMEIYRKKNANVVAVENVAREQVSRYGIIETHNGADRMKKMKSIVEKPDPDKAPSTLAVVGRYIFTPGIMSLLETTPRGAGNEIQLTDAIATLLEKEDVYLCEFQGRRYDCGSILGYMKANVEYALRHKTIGPDFRSYLDDFMKD